MISKKLFMEGKHMSLEGNNNRSLRIGIIGAGYAAGMHSNVLKEIDCSIVQYIFDINSDNACKFSAEYDCIVAETLDDLFHAADAVIIATPVWTHYNLVLEALKNRKHILCEKPMAQDCTEAQEMSELSKNANVICSVGFNYRFFDITRCLLDEIKDAAVQEIGLSIRRLFRNDWRRDETSVLSDLGIHLIDLLSVFSGGKIDTERCCTSMKYINTCDYEAEVKGYTDNNIAFNLEAARTDNPDEIYFCIQLKSDKIIKYDSRNMQIYTVSEGNEIYTKPVSKETTGRDFFDFFDSVMLQDKEWLNAVLGQDRSALASFDDGYQSQMILDKLLSMNNKR